jgi:uncharacterized protein YciI
MSPSPQRAALVRSIVAMSSPNPLDFYDAELGAHHEHLRAAYSRSWLITARRRG